MRWEIPWALPLLLLVAWLVWRTRRPAERPAAVLWVRTAGFGSRLATLAVRPLEVLPWVALALAVAAIARPQQGVRQTETETRGVDIELALDISPSMAAEDFRPSNRLAVAKQTARDFIRQRAHDRLGLVAFAGTAFSQCPLTLDHDALTELLEGLDIGLAEDGTAIGMGLATAVAGLKESRTPSRVVVLLTDGENNRGTVDPRTAAQAAAAFGMRIYTVGVGRRGEAPVPTGQGVDGLMRYQSMPVEIDEQLLSDVAATTGGRYFRATDSESLRHIFDEINRLEKTTVEQVVYRRYEEAYRVPLALGLLALALEVVLSATLAIRVP